MTIASAPFYNDIIKNLPLNTKGRDFVVGDIHGRFDLVDKALKAVAFDVLHDRLICVGDLIDRGADSWKVLGFLKRPYVHAVRGNHEDFLLRIYEIESPPEELIAHYAPSMGLQWWHNVQPTIRDLIIAELRNLPLVIEMETRRGTVGFLHAEVELGYNWLEFKTALHYQNDSVIHNALWGRKRLTRNFDVPIDGIDRVYVGHTVQTKIRQIGNIVGVDTGAVYNQHLTIANVEISSKAIDNMTLPLGNIQVVDNNTRISTPFSYAHSHYDHYDYETEPALPLDDDDDMFEEFSDTHRADNATTNTLKEETLPHFSEDFPILKAPLDINLSSNQDQQALETAEIEAQKKVELINQSEALAPPPINLAKAAQVAKTLADMKQSAFTKISTQDKTQKNKGVKSPRNKLKDLFASLEKTQDTPASLNDSPFLSPNAYPNPRADNSSSLNTQIATQIGAKSNLPHVVKRPKLDLDNLPSAQPKPLVLIKRRKKSPKEK